MTDPDYYSKKPAGHQHLQPWGQSYRISPPYRPPPASLTQRRLLALQSQYGSSFHPWPVEENTLPDLSEVATMGVMFGMVSISKLDFLRPSKKAHAYRPPHAKPFRPRQWRHFLQIDRRSARTPHQ
ncbi:MAG: hypothetical protein LJE64_07635 [Desulfofustis sp.]|nr:hypothetical protein [Desulfofustis sp.]